MCHMLYLCSAALFQRPSLTHKSGKSTKLRIPNQQQWKVLYSSPWRKIGSVSIVRKFDSPKIQLKLKLALTLTLTDTGDLRTIEPSDYRADTEKLWHKINQLFTHKCTHSTCLENLPGTISINLSMQTQVLTQ